MIYLSTSGVKSLKPFGCAQGKPLWTVRTSDIILNIMRLLKFKILPDQELISTLTEEFKKKKLIELFESTLNKLMRLN